MTPRRHCRAVGATAAASAFMMALGLNTALAVCGAPATQVTTGVTETAVVTFATVNSSNSPLVVAGITVNCKSGTAGTTVAAFFANSASGPTTGCTVTGALSGWTSGAANGTNVTFTSTTPNQNVTDIAVSGGGATVVTTQGSSGTLASTLGGNTVCVGTTGNFTNQEFHSGSTGGPIIDWKRGPSDPRDPTTTIGSWSLSGSQVSYTYTAGGSFNFTVWQQTNGTFDFCNGTTPAVSGAAIKPGQTAC